MPLLEKLKPQQYNLSQETFLATISGLYGSMVGILLETCIDGKDMMHPLLETPIQVLATGTGIAICAFRTEIYRLLEKTLGKEVQIE